MTDIKYKVVRSDRKTMVLVINSEAKLTVRAPFGTGEGEIKGFINQRKRWILEKQKKISSLNNKHSPVTFKNGESFMYQGSPHTIKYSNVSKIKVSDANILVPKTFKKEKIIAWLKREARKLITERLEKYADIMGVRYSTVRLSGARTRWGSCSGRDSLNFAWRLVMCPTAAIDYVIIHELCHITYKNHSPSFWAMVKRVCPKFKEQKSWLKNNRKLMDII
jgi:predicted metal-dependent hydrolase